MSRRLVLTESRTDYPRTDFSTKKLSNPYPVAHPVGESQPRDTDSWPIFRTKPRTDSAVREEPAAATVTKVLFPSSSSGAVQG